MTNIFDRIDLNDLPEKFSDTDLTSVLSAMLMQAIEELSTEGFIDANAHNFILIIDGKNNLSLSSPIDDRLYLLSVIERLQDKLANVQQNEIKSTVLVTSK